MKFFFSKFWYKIEISSISREYFYRSFHIFFSLKFFFSKGGRGEGIRSDWDIISTDPLSALSIGAIGDGESARPITRRLSLYTARLPRLIYRPVYARPRPLLRGGGDMLMQLRYLANIPSPPAGYRRDRSQWDPALCLDSVTPSYRLRILSNEMPGNSLILSFFSFLFLAASKSEISPPTISFHNLEIGVFPFLSHFSSEFYSIRWFLLRIFPLVKFVAFSSFREIVSRNFLFNFLNRTYTAIHTASIFHDNIFSIAERRRSKRPRRYRTFSRKRIDKTSLLHLDKLGQPSRIPARSPPRFHDFLAISNRAWTKFSIPSVSWT